MNFNNEMKTGENAVRKAGKLLIKYFSQEILSEEAGSAGKSDYKWLIDPIDGTHNFAFGVA